MDGNNSVGWHSLIHYQLRNLSNIDNIYLPKQEFKHAIILVELILYWFDAFYVFEIHFVLGQTIRQNYFCGNALNEKF